MPPPSKLKLAISSLARYRAPVRIGVFVLFLLLLWVPFAIPIALLVSDPNLRSILTLLVLYIEFLGLVRVWGSQVYQQPNLLWRYGLEFTRPFGLALLTGVAIGVGSVLVLFGFQGMLGWVLWQAPSIATGRIALEGGLVALAFGFAEELLFRGWLLDELERDYRPGTALVASSVIYAALHGFRSQFPALVLLGMTLVWAKRVQQQKQSGFWRGQLGLPIGLHAGLVWGYYLVKVGGLVQSTGRGPEWVTGLEGNPLAGLLGMLVMASLAGTLRYVASR